MFKNITLGCFRPIFARTPANPRAAVRLIFENLPLAWRDGKNLDAREAMALASHYAGLALNQAGLGYVHAIAHQLGAYYGVPHGRANAIVLPHVLAFNRQASSQRLATLARLTGLVDATSSDATAADALIAHVKALLVQLDIDTRVPGINRKDFQAMADAAFTEAHGIYAVPKYMSHAEAKSILGALRA